MGKYLKQKIDGRTLTNKSAMKCNGKFKKDVNVERPQRR